MESFNYSWQTDEGKRERCWRRLCWVPVSVVCSAGCMPWQQCLQQILGDGRECRRDCQTGMQRREWGRLNSILRERKDGLKAWFLSVAREQWQGCLCEWRWQDWEWVICVSLSQGSYGDLRFGLACGPQCVTCMVWAVAGAAVMGSMHGKQEAAFKNRNKYTRDCEGNLPSKTRNEEVHRTWDKWEYFCLILKAWNLCLQQEGAGGKEGSCLVSWKNWLKTSNAQVPNSSRLPNTCQD